MTEYLDIVLAPVAGTPDHTLVEIEADDGKGVALGTWVTRDDGFAAIRCTPTDLVAALGLVESLRAVLDSLTQEQRARVALRETPYPSDEPVDIDVGYGLRNIIIALEKPNA